MGKGSNTQTTTQTNTPPPEVLENYNYIAERAKNDALTPYTPYGGQTTAGLSDPQKLATSLYGNMMGDLNQYWAGAVGSIRKGMGPVDPTTYLSPYTKNVIDTTLANINRENNIQASDLMSKGIKQGNAFGGDRLGLAQAELARGQNMSRDQTIAGLWDKNYSQSLAAAQTDAARAMQAAGLYGTLGQNYGNLALNNIAGIANMGAVDQATDQAKLTSDYQQWQNQIAYPYQQTGWLSGILGGMGSGMGGTSTTSAPGPSTASQVGGGILGGIGLLGSTGAFGAAGWLTPMLAGLKDGGRVKAYASGGVVPESPETLLAQQEQLMEGERPAQMFPTGTPELPLPPGAERTEGPSGAFHFNPGAISPEALQGLSAAGRENEALGLGPFNKGDIQARIEAGEMPLVIVERNPAGVEVRASVGVPSTVAEQLEAMKASMSPENKLSVESLPDILAARQGSRPSASQGLGLVPQGAPEDLPLRAAGGGIPAPNERAFGNIPGVTESNPGLIPIATAAATRASGMGIPKAPEPKADTGMSNMLNSIKTAVPSLKEMSESLRAGKPLDLTAPYQGASTSNPNVDVTSPQAFAANSFGGSGLYKRGGSVPRFAEGGLAGKSVEPVDMGEVIDLTEDPRFILRNDNLGLGVRPQWANPALEADKGVGPVTAEGPEEVAVPSSRARPAPVVLPPQITRGVGEPSLPEGVTAYSAPKRSPAALQAPVEGLAPPTEQQVYEKPDVWQALAAAGFGMMAGTSPFAGVNIGRGALMGMQQYGEQKSAIAKARQLAEQAAHQRAQLQETTRANMTREQQALTTSEETRRSNRATEDLRREEMRVRREERESERQRRIDEAREKAQREDPLWITAQREKVADKYGLKGPARERYITEGKGLKDETQLSAADKKAIMTAEDELPVIDNTIDTLTRAKELNPQAFTGAFAGTRALAGAKLPDWMVPDLLADRKGAEASREFNQLMSMESIKTMASTLKGATTDRELAQFVEILGDPSTDAATRERTINRMLTLAKRQRELATSRIRDLRGGDYYKPADKRGSAATPVLSPADQQALDWARNNPNDPRAAQIKQRLGVP